MSAPVFADFTPPPIAEPLTELEEWLGTYIKTAQPEDLWTLTLWCVHTHLVEETFTSPRLLLDSPAPGSGKTTVLDHLKHLAFNPVQAASLSSPSLLARLLQRSPRTILIDEADRSLHPKMDGVGELLAVLNSGYRVGASRPVLVKKDNDWEPVEMSTFGPVAMAGNAPDLPDDTRSRCIRVLLLPDTEGVVQDSDWQYIEIDALDLAERIIKWADEVRTEVKEMKPEYPAGLKGRNRERWSPMLKVAQAAGGEWPERCLRLIANDLDEQEMDREAGLQQRNRHVDLIRDIAEMWPESVPFMPTEEILQGVKQVSPHQWTAEHKWGDLTAQAFGRMLVKHYSIRSDRRERGGDRRRGYWREQFHPAWKAFGIPVGLPDPLPE